MSELGLKPAAYLVIEGEHPHWRLDYLFCKKDGDFLAKVIHRETDEWRGGSGLSVFAAINCAMGDPATRGDHKN